MSPRARVILLVGLAALGAAGLTVGVTVVTSGKTGSGGAPVVGKPRPGAPPLALGLGVRIDPEAVALRRASALYEQGRRGEAGRIFAGYRSPAARIGVAFARWPNGSLRSVQELATEEPRSSLVQLHLGLALYWSGRNSDAVTALRNAASAQPDTPWAVTADNFLHPRMPPGLPQFVPGFRPPAALGKLPPPRQLEALAAAARSGGVRAKLLYGVALQRLGHPVSAERVFAAAAAAAPDDPEAQVAAAVGRFDKEHPERAFGQLGPLARRFPRAPTVRFHLGLLLLWLDQVGQARKELARARAEAPATPIGREAGRLLQSLRGVGTG